MCHYVSLCLLSVSFFRAFRPTRNDGVMYTTMFLSVFNYLLRCYIFVHFFIRLFFFLIFVSIQLCPSISLLLDLCPFHLHRPSVRLSVGEHGLCTEYGRRRIRAAVVFFLRTFVRCSSIRPSIRPSVRLSSSHQSRHRLLSTTIYD